ncbi:hypothetical protein [Sporolactobacillus nakayamae]|uniref:Uncharacterized protein n=1 Tax=Sporolactobacillus nakayamae TaxID=269670 RepID=A0A1I2U132_9BACL|nr:hypothetical protein [Sporolactobacillus nakayamae]SFG70842.1 hypothetical protein SAMN02982927_02513 [Sporolactobacillus nakayamae]
MEILMKECELGFESEGNVWVANIKSIKELISLHCIFDERKRTSEVFFRLKDDNGKWRKLIEFIIEYFPSKIENNFPKIEFFKFEEESTKIEEPRKNEGIFLCQGEVRDEEKKDIPTSFWDEIVEAYGVEFFDDDDDYYDDCYGYDDEQIKELCHLERVESARSYIKEMQKLNREGWLINGERPQY